MSRSSRRGPWLPEEDATLLHLVRTQGPNNWVRISQHMQHRSPKQCRERYHQNLKPSLNHEPISAQEGEMIERLVHDMGKRWAEIARRLGNRSDNAVKNWWNGSMNRRKRNTVQQSGVSRIVGYRTQPIPASAPPPPHHLYGEHGRSQDSLQPVYPVSLPFRAPDVQLPAPSMVNSQATVQEHGYRERPQPDRLQSQPSSPWFSSDRPPSIMAIPRSSPFGLPYPGEKSSTPSESHARMQFSDGPDYQLPPLNMMQVSAPSPTGSEASHGSSHRQAPSLVSDNQSTCSISPKTVTSPRPGMTAPQGPPVEVWPEIHGRNSTEHTRGDYVPGDRKARSEGYSSTMSASWKPSNMELSPDLARPLSLPSPAVTCAEPPTVGDRVSCLQTSKANALGERDARMNVSRLLD